MSYQNNSQAITKELQERLGLSELTGYPRKVADSIVPVIEVSSIKTNVCVGLGAPTSGNFVPYTTPANKDFYLTGFTYNLSKDATCDIATSYYSLQMTTNTGVIQLYTMGIITLTAQHFEVSVQFANPIKLPRGTAFANNMTYTAGLMSRGCNLYGYTVDNVGA